MYLKFKPLQRRSSGSFMSDKGRLTGLGQRYIGPCPTDQGGGHIEIIPKHLCDVVVIDHFAGLHIVASCILHGGQVYPRLPLGQAILCISGSTPTLMSCSLL